MKITFTDGQENRVIVEKQNERDTSIFFAQYQRANAVYVALSDAANGRKEVDNNIIAFCGDRGTGKTSCMESFREQLVDSNAQYIYALKTIDPSFFDDNHNILQLILGQIYQAVQDFKTASERSEMFNLHQCEVVLVELNKAIRYLKYLSKPDEKPHYYDGLEELEYLAAGLHLKNCIAGVVREFLHLIGRRQLIVSIDDLDLNTVGSYTMAEHIRKYLAIDSCIILLSVNVDQLVDVIKVQLEKNEAGSDESYGMAVKYITKFLPMGNRVLMPSLENYCNAEFEYRIGNQSVHFNSIKEAVTQMIFWKTGYLFYNSKGSSSLVVPRSLRSMRQLMHLLAPMTDHYGLELETLRANQQIFRDYFFHTWTKQLDKPFRERIDKILQTTNTLSLNKTVVSQLADAGKDKDLSRFADILNQGNYAYNISLGDVMSIMEYMSQDESDRQLQLFLFFIRSYYSMRLYEAYDDITENPKKELYPETDAEAREIYATDALFDSTNELQKIVNGQFFTYASNDLLPENSADYSRDLHLINGEILTDHLRRLLGQSEIKDEADRAKFRLIEFFILCVSRGVSLKKTTDSWAKKRDISLPVHSMFNHTRKHMVFDVIAPFYNVLNLKNTYNRFNSWLPKNLYDFAKSRDWTLLSRLGAAVPNREFLTDAVIRNAEVLAAMGEKLKEQRTHRRPSEDYKCLSEFYGDIISSEMRTYPREVDGEPYTIRFGFLKKLQKVLKDCDPQFFAAVFSPVDMELNIQQV